MAQALGWLILLMAAASAAMATAAAMRRGRWERRRLAAEDDFFAAKLRQLGERAEGERAASAGAWSGYRKFKITRREDAARDVCTFFFKPHDGKSPPPFAAGQFVTFRLKTGDNRPPTVRCYSLSDAPGDEYQVTIKRVAAPPDAPDAPPGEASSYFHDQVREGDILDMTAPAGRFTMKESAGRPVVMLAGGVGVTPFLAMLAQMAADGDRREAWLFYGVRNRAEHIAARRLRALGERLPNLKTLIFYSQPEAGEECDFAEKITMARIKERLPSNNYEFYLCGPPQMMDDLIAGLKEWGVPHGALRYEAFGKESVKRRSPQTGGEAGYKIVFAKSGITARWTGESGSILDVCEQNGVAAESGCRAGNCRACLAPVRGGEVRYISRPGCEVENGSCLICCTVPASDVTIDL